MWGGRDVRLAVTLDINLNCRAGAGLWYGASAMIYKEASDTADINCSVPIKNVHNSDGRVWPPTKRLVLSVPCGDADDILWKTYFTGNSPSSVLGAQ